MKVGLIRHFQVARGYPANLVTAEELMTWVKEYDDSEVIEKEVDLGNVDWKRCFSSDLPRAQVTAEKIFNGQITYLPELREVALAPYCQLNVKLPLYWHLLMTRGAWLLDHKSQPDSRQKVKRRMNQALDMIFSSREDTLIVGHGGMMMFMRRELDKRGFTGPKFTRPANAKLYVYEKIPL